jgi:hypothetical protein
VSWPPNTAGPHDSLRQIADADEAHAAATAAALAEELKIAELLLGAEFLRGQEAVSRSNREKMIGLQ